MHDTEFPGLFRSLGVSAVLLVGSRLWLRRFTTGPAEMLQKAVLR